MRLIKSSQLATIKGGTGIDFGKFIRDQGKTVYNPQVEINTIR